MKHLALLLFLAAMLPAQIFSPPGAVRRYSGTPTAGDCNANALNRLASDITAIPTVYSACIQTSSGVYAWTNIAASGSGSGDVLGGSNLTTAGAIPYVSASGTLNQDANIFRGTNGDGSRAIVIKAGGSPNQYPSYDIQNSSGTVIGQLQHDGANGVTFMGNSALNFNLASTRRITVSSTATGIGPSNTSPTGTLHVYDATGTSGDTVVTIRDGAAAAARINFAPNSSATADLGLRHSSANNLGITNGSSTTYWTLGAGGIQSGVTTWNDPSSSGTVASKSILGIAAPTLTATSSTTFTTASTLRIGGAPTASTNVTIGTGYALEVAAGNTLLAGNATVGGDVIGATTSFYYWGATGSDGSWRMGLDSGNIVIQKRESGSWVSKQVVTP